MAGAPAVTQDEGRLGHKSRSCDVQVAWQRHFRRLNLSAMTDNESLAQLQKALQDGRADVAFTGGITNHLDFPGNSESDKGQFILAGLALMLLAYWKGTWLIVGGVFVLLVAIYWLFWRRIVLRRMRARFIGKVMGDLKLWRKSWTFNGVKLTAAGQECLSPKGDWRAFAAGLGAAPVSPARLNGASAGSQP
jgi:hypothetical protein